MGGGLRRKWDRQCVFHCTSSSKEAWQPKKLKVHGKAGELVALIACSRATSPLLRTRMLRSGMAPVLTVRIELSGTVCSLVNDGDEASSDDPEADGKIEGDLGEEWKRVQDRVDDDDCDVKLVGLAANVYCSAANC